MLMIKLLLTHSNLSLPPPKKNPNISPANLAVLHHLDVLEARVVDLCPQHLAFLDRRVRAPAGQGLQHVVGHPDHGDAHAVARDVGSVHGLYAVDGALMSKLGTAVHQCALVGPAARRD